VRTTTKITRKARKLAGAVRICDDGMSEKSGEIAVGCGISVLATLGLEGDCALGILSIAANMCCPGLVVIVVGEGERGRPDKDNTTI